MIKSFIRKILLKEKIPMPTSLFYFFLKLLSTCRICLDGYLFPIHGTAPHEHDINFNTFFLSKDKWPCNYVEKGDNEGIYYCSNENCFNSKTLMGFMKGDFKMETKYWLYEVKKGETPRITSYDTYELALQDAYEIDEEYTWMIIKGVQLALRIGLK